MSRISEFEEQDLKTGRVLHYLNLVSGVNDNDEPLRDFQGGELTLQTTCEKACDKSMYLKAQYQIGEGKVGSLIREELLVRYFVKAANELMPLIKNKIREIAARDRREALLAAKEEAEEFIKECESLEGTKNV